MRTDTFTRSVLSIIAICLLYICIQDVQIIPEANANSSAPYAGYGLVPVNPDGSITISFSDEKPMPVKLVEIEVPEDGNSFRKTNLLSVNITQVDGEELKNELVPVKCH